MSEKIYLLTICLPLLAVLVVFAMKYFAAIQQARANDAYRQLAAQTAAQQAETLATLAALRAAVADSAARLASVEKMLKQVE